MSPIARAMYDGLWNVVEAATDKRRPQFEDAASVEVWERIAAETLSAARTAYSYGSRGTQLEADAAARMFLAYYADKSIPRRLADHSLGERDAEIQRFWCPAARALLAAAQAERSRHQAEAA